MPELPEVETVRRGAAPHLTGRRLVGFTATRPDLRWPMPIQAVAKLAGATCQDVGRRSKYLLLGFDDPEQSTVLVHLGMSGRLAVDVVSTGGKRPEWQLHEHWRMDFGDRLVRFTDPRRFGALDIGRSQDLARHKLIRDLGLEPLALEFDGAWLHRRSRKRKVATKVFLMDARHVVGVGNIYASEACWRAGVRPGRAAGRLTQPECAELATQIKAVLVDAIAAGGTTLRDYVGVDAGTGYFQRDLAVYGRAGEICLRCGDTVKQTTHSNRSTYYCPGCQS